MRKTFLKICAVLVAVIAAALAPRFLGAVRAIPPNVSPYFEQADYILDIGGGYLKGRADFKVRAFRQGEFRLLSSQVALTSITVDSKERSAIEKDGFYVIPIGRRKECTVKIEFVKKIEEKEDEHNLSLIVPRASKNRIQLRGIRGQHVILNGRSFNEFATPDMPDVTSLILPPTNTINISWQRSKTGAKPARVFARRYTLIEVKDESMYYRTIYDYRIRDGKVSSLRWFLAENSKEIKVEGPGVHSTKIESRGKQKLVQVYLTSPTGGDYRLELSYSLDYKDEMGQVLTARPDEVLNEDEYIVIGSREELQIVSVEETALKKISLDEVPSQLVKITEIPMFKAYHRVDSRGRLRLAFIKYGQAEGVETAVDKAEYEVYVSPSGEEIVRATFEVRNTHKQFMRLRLPEKAILYSARLLDKTITPLRLQDGTVLIPLEKSIESFSGYVTFPVDIVYIIKRKTGIGKQISAALPSLGVPTSYLKWRLILPEDSKIKWKRMDVHSVEQFSDERAVRTLEYARASAAAGEGQREISEEASLIDALKVFEGVMKSGETDEEELVEGSSMPTPQVIGKKFERIDFGKLYRKVTDYSKKVAEEESSKVQKGVKTVIVSGDIVTHGFKLRGKDINQKLDEEAFKGELSSRYSREAQRDYRSGRLKKAQKQISRALRANIASKEALQLAENVQKLQQLEKEEAMSSSISQTVPADTTDAFVNEEEISADGKSRLEEKRKESRIYAQVKTYRKGRRGRRLGTLSELTSEDKTLTVEQPPPVEPGAEREPVDMPEGPAPTALPAAPVMGDSFYVNTKDREAGRPLLLRYHLLLVPEDLSRRIGKAIENRAEPASQEATADYTNWKNSADFYDLNALNTYGYNRMNLDTVQEDTLIDILNKSYGAGNILASRMVRVKENSVFNIPFAGPGGTEYAKVRPVVVGDDYIDFYVTMPRPGRDGQIKEEETAVRIKRGQTAVLGGISGSTAAVGQRGSGLVLMLNSNILEKMTPEEVEHIYTRRYMDISVPSGDVYNFEKLLVKADEVLTITMEVEKWMR